MSACLARRTLKSAGLFRDERYSNKSRHIEELFAGMVKRIVAKACQKPKYIMEVNEDCLA